MDVVELTRRRFVAGGVAAGAALLLPGCGGDDGERESLSTRVIETGKGRVRVPADPRRIAALGGGDVDTVLALGVEPVAAYKDTAAPGGVPPWRRGRLDPARTQLISVDSGVPLERVAALKPDLILSGFWGFDDSYEKLSRIAPTIAPHKDMIVDTLQQRTLLLGRAIGREQRARRLLADTDARVEALKARYPGLAGKSFTFSLLQAPTQIGIATGRDIYSTRLMTRLGLHVGPRPRGSRPGRAASRRSARSGSRCSTPTSCSSGSARPMPGGRWRATGCSGDCARCGTDATCRSTSTWRSRCRSRPS